MRDMRFGGIARTTLCNGELRLMPLYFRRYKKVACDDSTKTAPQSVQQGVRHETENPFDGLQLRDCFAPLPSQTAMKAKRGRDGEVKIIYWQAPSILNPICPAAQKTSNPLRAMSHGPLRRTGAWLPFLAGNSDC